jgi:pyruvate,water dikinase
MQGEISSRSWREDPTPVTRLAATFAQLGDDDDPRDTERRRVDERLAAERELLAGVGRARRVTARAVLAAAHAYIPAREIGKAALVMALDVGRSAARTIGRDLASRGVLDDAEDVFHLTIPELLAESPPASWRELVAARRAQRQSYLELELPESWVGVVQPRVPEAPGGAAVQGIGVSPGIVEGRARVVLDLAEDAVEPDEILVCETTDPSWAAYFLVASGVVIDIGGAMSHGAIVAREVGIPCVINTRIGTRALRTGDRIRVDGGTGAVTVLDRPT